MKFLSTILSAALLASSADAFSPAKQFGVKPGNKIARPTIVSQSETHPALWKPPQMVAGGAEKAYGEEYYDGMWIFGATGRTRAHLS